MEQLIRFETIAEYNQAYQHETLHPLVTVIDLSRSPGPAKEGSKIYFGFYAIFLKDVKCGDLTYGRATYDYQEGTLVFIAPGQVVGVTRKPEVQPRGYVLAFHPDLIHGTSLGKHIHEYTFFGYQSNEALHISEREREIVLDCLDKIQGELMHFVDKHSRRLIVSNIELFLNYCVRFYDRQFTTREHVNKGILEQFEALLHAYLYSGKMADEGLPSVSRFADLLHLSPNYFGDLVKREMGVSAQEYIQSRLIEVAKEKLFDYSKSVSEVAYALGFRYPQHFTRLFKQKVGISPSEFRNLN
ncbi:MAG: helix-turn-helix transcriptional regulator [Thermoflavifilum aggregans]|nr:helix-turn-helix transcriptional regulator [Thermoflavifilum aggregans]